MNIRNILKGGIALVAMTTFAQAANVTNYFTGSTAFRYTVITALKALYETGNSSGRSYSYVHNGAAGQATNATQVVFSGNFPGNNSATTTIYLSWGGSISGMKNVKNASNVAFLSLAGGQALPTPVTATGGAENALNTTAPTTVNHSAEFAFSDALQTSAPVAQQGLLPASAAEVGVVIFVPVVNKGTVGIANTTTQQFKNLFSAGSLPRQLWTGNSANTDSVYAVGRDDGSGTRAIYLAETGLGFTKTLNQYCATTYSGNTITKIQLVPKASEAAFGNSANFKASTLWGNNQAGNGGYATGDAINADFGKTTAATTVWDNTDSPIETAASISLMTFLGGADAKTAVDAGATAIQWNGVGLTSLIAANSAISSTDADKIYNGTYSAWSYENLYYKTTPTGDSLNTYTKLKTQIATVLNSLVSFDGVAVANMIASRSDDGAPIGF